MLAAIRRRRADTLGQPGFGAANRFDRVLIAGFRGVAPGDEAVAGQYDAANVRIGMDRVAQAQAQVEAGPLPWQPSELAAEDFARESFAVARRRDRDNRIGMDMINMRERQERMKRSIDAGGARAAGKGAIVEVWHELIFVLAAAKAAFQRDELVLIQLREAGQIHRAQIVAGTFHP